MSDTMTPKPAFEAAIFDLDGTLIDTETLCNETGVAACANLGHDVSHEFFLTLAGVDDFNRAARIGQEVGKPVDPAAFMAEWDRLCALRFAEGIPVKPGAAGFLAGLVTTGLPIALCTSSRRSQTDLKLQHTDLEKFFTATISYDDVRHAKPNPDAYLTAARALGVAPERCIAFEDSETGAQSAWEAGMCVVQVPDQHPTKGRFAHHVAPTLAQGARAAGLHFG